LNYSSPKQNITNLPVFSPRSNHTTGPSVQTTQFLQIPSNYYRNLEGIKQTHSRSYSYDYSETPPPQPSKFELFEDDTLSHTSEEDLLSEGSNVVDEMDQVSGNDDTVFPQFDLNFENLIPLDEVEKRPKHNRSQTFDFMDEEIMKFENFYKENSSLIQQNPSPKNLNLKKLDHRRVLSYDPNYFKERNEFPSNDFFL